MYIVYKTTNIITGHYYIGSHKLPTNGNKDTYLGSGKELKKQLKHYDRSVFVRETLFKFENANDAINMEHTLIKQYKNDPLCLNKSTGGQNFDYINQSGLNNSANNCAKGGQKNKELIQTNPEYAKKFSDHIKAGFTDEVRTHMSQLMLNNTNFLGHKHTTETKRKIGEKTSLHQLGTNNSQYGTYWITDGQVNKKWHDNKGVLPDGFRKGRIVQP